jgi:CRP/FNR family transcriptional regulator, cyclic AMP receptor protein
MLAGRQRLNVQCREGPEIAGAVAASCHNPRRFLFIGIRPSLACVALGVAKLIALLAILQTQEVFGEMALLDGKERTAEARAMEECTLAVLERRAVLSFLDRHPHVWPKLAAVLCSRLRNTNEHIAELALLELPARLAKALLRFGNVDGRLHNGRAPLKVQLSQRELGNVCGATRESINKCLGGWQRRGIVQIEESLVTIANQTALEELAELAPW